MSHGSASSSSYPRALLAILAVVVLLRSDSSSRHRRTSHCQVMALAVPRTHRTRTATSASSSRAFTVQLRAPPLVPLDLEGEEASVARTGRPSSSYQSSLDIVYTNDPRSVAAWLQERVPSSSSGCAVLGFDTESVPTGAPWISPHRVNFWGPATVQLSTVQSSLVIHLARRNGRPCQSCGPVLQTVLRNPHIVKAGCSIDDDLLDLREKRWPNLEARSRLDLSGLRSSGSGSDETTTTTTTTGGPGLKRLAQTVLGLDLPKKRKISASDWSRMPLTEEQVVYAARDAWVAAAVVDQLQYIDAHTFDPNVLVERLQASQQQQEEEVSLHELTQRRTNRREAKALLTALYGPPELRSRPFQLPEWKLSLVSELRSIIRDNRPKTLLYPFPFATATTFERSFGAMSTNRTFA